MNSGTAVPTVVFDCIKTSLSDHQCLTKASSQRDANGNKLVGRVTEEVYGMYQDKESLNFAETAFHLSQQCALCASECELRKLDTFYKQLDHCSS